MMKCRWCDYTPGDRLDDWSLLVAHARVAHKSEFVKILHKRRKWLERLSSPGQPAPNTGRWVKQK